MQRKVNKQTNLTWMIVTGVVAILLVGMFALTTKAQGVRGILCNLTGCEFSADDFSVVLSNLLPAPEKITLGASAGPDRFNEFESRNGNKHFYYGGPLTQGTTTAFAVPIPTATSTLNMACSILIASTSATTWTIAETLNINDAHATTTALSTVLIAADQPGFITHFATTTVLSTGVTANNNLILSVSGGVSGEDEFLGKLAPGFVPVGSCSVDINVL